MRKLESSDLKLSLQSALHHLVSALDILDRAGAPAIMGAHIAMAADHVRSGLSDADAVTQEPIEQADNQADGQTSLN